MKSIPAFEQLDNNRFRERFGLYYDDFKVGAIIEHYPGRTITEADNVWMSLLCMNTHPLHIDSMYGEKTEWGKNLVSSLITLAIVGGLSLKGTSAMCTVNLGWEEIKLLSPVFVGDTIYAESEILDKRLSQSRNNEGIIKVKTIGKKQDGTVFLWFIRHFLVPIENEVLNHA